MTASRSGLVRAQALQFCLYFGLGSSLPYFSLYFKKTLIEPFGEGAAYMVGSLFFLRAFSSVLGAPLAGILADTLQVRRQILTIIAFIAAMGAVLLSVPALVPSAAGWGVIHVFLILAVGMIVSGLFGGPTIPLIDSESLSAIQTSGRKSKDYGRIRLWGSVGWTLASVVVVLFIRNAENYAAVPLFMGAGFLALSFLAFFGVRVERRPISLPWKSLLTNRPLRRMLIFVFFLSLGMKSAFQFSAWFLDDINVGIVIIGLSFGFSAIPEIPFMFFSNRILERWGDRRMVIFGALVGGFRLLLFLPAMYIPWIAVPVQALHGVSYSFYYIGIIHIIDRISHHDLKSTYLSLYIFIWALGSAVAGYFGATIIELLGSTWLIGIDGLIMLVATLYFALTVRLDSHAS